MKSIAVVTDSRFKYGRPSRIGETIKSNILAVFEGKVSVATYYVDTLTEEGCIREDLVILMAGSRGIKVRRFVKQQDAIIVAKRTFQKEKIYPLFNIPEGTDVLVVNDDIETVLDSISSLYHIGVKHVNLIPFEAGKTYPEIKHAITPSEPELVPPSVEKLYNVGNRVVDIPTMLQISSILRISDGETRQRLYDYNQEIFSPNEGIIENYNNLLTRTEEMDQILELSHDGILLTDMEGKIHIHNRRFLEIFKLKENPAGKFLHQVLEKVELRKYYDDHYHDGLVSFGERIINLEKRNVRHFNRESRMYFSFQEVTHIKKLEQNLTRKLRKRGQVARYTFRDIIYSSPDMGVIIDKAKKIARTSLTVLITGETGTGKEILAQAIHNASDRQLQPFIAINCAAIPDNLMESELFGYAAGSFTGALRGGKQGLFEQANNGTVFLDEIGDMPGHLQSKLLRVLQERQVTPVGSDHIIDVDIRVIAATHKSPTQMIEDGSFRKDLFYRLNVFPLELSPLRDRKEDVPFLLKNFTSGRFRFSRECLDLLDGYHWPGNVRELSNIAQYISTTVSGEEAGVESLPLYIIQSRKRRSGEVQPTGVPAGAAATDPVTNPATVPGSGIPGASGPGNRPESRQVSQPDDRPESRELFLLGLQCSPRDAFAILEAIRTLQSLGKSAGRKHILNLLEASGRGMSESPLRRILSVLEGMELITVHRGRKGCRLSEKGKMLLRGQTLEEKVMDDKLVF